MKAPMNQSAPSLFVVLPFFLTGALIFLGVAVFLFLHTEALTGHYFQWSILTLVHACAIGWGTMLIFGSVYQLLPVINGRPLYSNGLAYSTFICLFIGLLSLLVGFYWTAVHTWLILGGSLILLAFILYSVNVFKTSFPSNFQSMEKLFLMSASIWLIFTALLGLALAINLAHPFVRISHLEYLKIHAHLGLGGWFLQLITGISIKLIPMFALGKSEKQTWLVWAFYLQNLGLLGFFIDGLFFGISPSILIYWGLILWGTLAWLAYLWDAFKNRLRRKLDMPLQHTYLSSVLLLFGFICIPLIYFLQDVGLIAVYGIFLFLGWISVLILGMTFKTLPFIVWNTKYKGIHGKIQIPLPKQLYKTELVNIQYWACVFALIFMGMGLLMNLGILVKIGSLAWLLVAVLYVINVFLICGHKPQDINGNFIKRPLFQGKE